MAKDGNWAALRRVKDMIDFFFAVMAAGLNSVADPSQGDRAQGSVIVASPGVVVSEQSVVIGDNVQTGGAAAVTPAPAPAPVVVAPQPVAPVAVASPYNMVVVPAGLVAEPQTPSGKFTTATEIKPILNATKGNWVAVRDYDGSDLLYVTHLWSWRCGLAGMAISVNGEAMQNWPLPPCHMEYATPNAILDEDGLPYLRLRRGVVQSVTIQIVYDDLSMDVATFQRSEVLIP
jgi:hypothetical protein